MTGWRYSLLTECRRTEVLIVDGMEGGGTHCGRSGGRRYSLLTECRTEVLTVGRSGGLRYSLLTECKTEVLTVDGVEDGGTHC